LGLFLKNKSEAFAKFKIWKTEVENQTGMKIKCFRTNNGTEYKDGDFLKFYEEHGIKRHFTIRKTPQQNGVVLTPHFATYILTLIQTRVFTN
jgi:transposase InsO family protein